MNWKAIGITDIHMAQRHTRYRVDAGDDIVDKLVRVAGVCIENTAHLLVAGDWFHSAHVGYSSVARLHQVLLGFTTIEDIRVKGVAGQHDLPDHGNWHKGPLYPISWLGGRTIVGEGLYADPGSSAAGWARPGVIAPRTLFIPFGSWPPDDGVDMQAINPDLIIIHAMIVPKPVPWDHIAFEEFAELVPDGKQRLILCGDYHAGFEPTQVRNLLFVNPGALTRVKRDEAYRKPKYAAIEWDGETFSVEYHVIPHRPGDEVFDMSDYGAETMSAPDGLSEFVEQVRALDSDAGEIDVDAAAQQLWTSLWPDTEPQPDVVAILKRALENAKQELGYGG